MDAPASAPGRLRNIAPPTAEAMTGTTEAHAITTIIRSRWSSTNGMAPSQTRSVGGLAEHHPARRRHRLHPLGHSDLFADRSVSTCARTNFACDHLTRVQAHAQSQVDAPDRS